MVPDLSSLEVLQAELPMLQPLAVVGSIPLVMSIYMGMLKCLPMLFTFAALPLLDWILGEEDAQELGTPSSPWPYDVTFYGFAALHMASVLTTVYIASLPGTSALQILLLCLNQGVTGGYAINTAHELTHHSNKAHKALGEALLTSCCYKHWPHSHRAHHAQVCSVFCHKHLPPWLVGCMLDIPGMYGICALDSCRYLPVVCVRTGTQQSPHCHPFSTLLCATISGTKPATRCLRKDPFTRAGQNDCPSCQ